MPPQKVSSSSQERFRPDDDVDIAECEKVSRAIDFVLVQAILRADGRGAAQARPELIARSGTYAGRVFAQSDIEFGANDMKTPTICARAVRYLD